MQYKMFFLIGLLFFSSSVFSAPKLITCTDSDVMQKAKDLRAQANSDFWKQHMEEYIPERLELASLCESAEFATKNRFSLDTDDLQKEVFDLEASSIYFCGTLTEDVKRKKGRATNSVISITTSDAGDIFNIDRATLKGGSGIKRNFSCVIEDIVVKNQI